MFALERAPALLLGIIAWYWLDDGPLQAQWLTSAEKQRLTTELGIERHNTVARDGSSLIEALRNPHTHLFAFVLFALTSALLLLLF